MIALATGLAERTEDGSVVFRPPADEAASFSAGSTVQRVAEDAPTTPTPSAPPSEQASPASGAPASEQPASRKPEELDRLAHDLYERIRYRLKNELRLDRERAGLLTDLIR